MTPYQKRLTPTMKRIAGDMKIRNLSPRTIDCYTYHIDRFENFVGKNLAEATPEDIRSFQLFLIEEKKASWSTFNQAVCALRFLYRFTIPRPWPVAMIPFGKKPKTLPAVLSHSEVERLFECVPNRKHQTLLITLYAAGLRLSEGSHLTLPDIDSERMLLRVASGKGNRERLVPLSPRLLEELRRYWKEYRPDHYLFPGKMPERPVAGTTIHKAFKLAAAKAGIKKHPISPHTLRHTGVPPFFVQG